MFVSHLAAGVLVGAVEEPVEVAGASEVEVAGASEVEVAVASDMEVAGASDMEVAGASEVEVAGASEVIWVLSGIRSWLLVSPIGGARMRQF